MACPIHPHEGRSSEEEVDLLMKKGFFRLYFDNRLHDMNDETAYPKSKEDIKVVIDRFKIEKGKIRDNSVKERMRDIVPTFEETDFRIPPDGEIEIPKERNPETRFLERNEITFLKDIQEQPDSGIAARYKQLGLSVRQGQKVKTKLLEQGLIEEDQETTRIGRRTVIRLSEKGKVALSGAN